MKTTAVGLSSEQRKASETREKRGNKLLKFAGRGLAAFLLAFPMIDIAASDGAAAKEYTALEHTLNKDNNPIGQLEVDAVVLLSLVGYTAVVGTGLARSKTLHNFAKDFDEYTEKQKRERGEKGGTFNGVRNGVYTAIKWPFETVGAGFDSAGKFMEQRQSTVAQYVGTILVETGAFNTQGFNLTVTQTSNNNPPSVGTTIRNGFEFGGVWVGGAEIVRGVDHIPGVSDVLGPIGREFIDLTSIVGFHEIPQIVNSGDVFLTGLALAFGIKGLIVANHRARRVEDAVLYQGSEASIPQTQVEA